jgi:hypothetical protein
VTDVFLLAEQVPEFKGIGLNLTEKYVHVDTRKQAHREIWVVEMGKRQELTSENRAKYFGEHEKPELYVETP